MHYTPMQQLDTRQHILIDTHDLAHLIESMLEPVLQVPAVGLYLPNQLDPVLVEGGNYLYEQIAFVETEVQTGQSINMNLRESYVMTDNGNMMSVLQANQSVLNLHTTPWKYYHYEYIPVLNLHEVAMSPWDIVHGNSLYGMQTKLVALPHHLAPHVSFQPTLPARGLKMLCQLIANEIDGSRAFGRRMAKTIEEVIFPFIRPEFQQLEHMRSDRWFQETLNMVFDATLPTVSLVRDQLRNNLYQMCSVHHHEGYQLRIEQLGDYRIMEWERITADPEYQRWQQARTNGDWDRYTSAQEEIIVNNSAYVLTNNPYR